MTNYRDERLVSQAISSARNTGLTWDALRKYFDTSPSKVQAWGFARPMNSDYHQYLLGCLIDKIEEAKFLNLNQEDRLDLLCNFIDEVRMSRAYDDSFPPDIDDTPILKRLAFDPATTSDEVVEFGAERYEEAHCLTCAEKYEGSDKDDYSAREWTVTHAAIHFHDTVSTFKLTWKPTTDFKVNEIEVTLPEADT